MMKARWEKLTGTSQVEVKEAKRDVGTVSIFSFSGNTVNAVVYTDEHLLIWHFFNFTKISGSKYFQIVKRFLFAHAKIVCMYVYMYTTCTYINRHKTCAVFWIFQKQSQNSKTEDKTQEKHKRCPKINIKLSRRGWWFLSRAVQAIQWKWLIQKKVEIQNYPFRVGKRAHKSIPWDINKCPDWEEKIESCH